MVKIALLCDEPVLVRGLREVIKPDGELCLDLVVQSAEALLDALSRSEPEVLLVDFSDNVSFSLLASVCQQFPTCKILLWTRNVPIHVAHSAYELGLRGIVRKDLSTELLVRCLRVVAEGELWYERSTLQSLHDAKTVKLTRRETQLLTLVGQGLSNKEIGSELDLTEGTVKFYMSRLFKKMQVRDRFELALYGLETMFRDAGTRRVPTQELVVSQVPRSIVLDPYLSRPA